MSERRCDDAFACYLCEEPLGHDGKHRNGANVWDDERKREFAEKWGSATAPFDVQRPSCDSAELAAIRAMPPHLRGALEADALLRIVDEQAAIIRADPMLEWQQSYDSLKAERDELRAALATKDRMLMRRQEHIEAMRAEINELRDTLKRHCEFADSQTDELRAKLAEAEARLNQLLTNMGATTPSK
jgi:hypothetical protein